MDPFWAFLTFIGASFCHQLPERSYFLGDLQMPLCARCIGIHTGFLLSSVLMWTGARRFASGMQEKKVVLSLAAVAFAGFALGILSYAGLGFDDNTSRTVSGLMIGTPLPFIVVPVLNMIAFPGKNGRMSLSTPLDLLMLIAVFAFGATIILLATGSAVLFYLASLLGILGITVFVFTMVTIMVSLLTDEKNLQLRSRLAISGLFSVVVLLVLNAGHFALLP
jgi:uncharacterized membrane protein